MLNHDCEILTPNVVEQNLDNLSSSYFTIKKNKDSYRPPNPKRLSQKIKKTVLFKPNSKPTEKTVMSYDKPLDSILLENFLEEKDHGETLAYINFYEKNKKLLEQLEKDNFLTQLEYMKLQAQRINVYKYKFLLFLRDAFLKDWLVQPYNVCQIQLEDHIKFISVLRNTILNLMNSNIYTLGEIYNIKVKEDESSAIAIEPITDLCLTELDFTRLPKELQKILSSSFGIGIDRYNQLIQQIKEMKITLHKISTEKIASCIKINEILTLFEKTAAPDEYSIFKGCVMMINQLKSAFEGDIFIKDAKIELCLKRLSQTTEAKNSIFRHINLQIANLINQLSSQPHKKTEEISIIELSTIFQQIGNYQKIKKFEDYHKKLKNQNLESYSFTDENLLDTIYLYRITGEKSLANEILKKSLTLLKIHKADILIEKENIRISNFSCTSNFFSTKLEVPKIQQTEQPAECSSTCVTQLRLDT